MVVARSAFRPVSGRTESVAKYAATLEKGSFQVTFDRRFREVMESCRMPRDDGGDETWIHDEMIEAYSELHTRGFAHSVEVWQEGELVGGLYGISLGKCFFGESMFKKVSNASKVALVTLTRKLQALGFAFIDCQVYTDHLQSLGARMIPRPRFLQMLGETVSQETLKGDWDGWMLSLRHRERPFACL